MIYRFWKRRYEPFCGSGSFLDWPQLDWPWLLAISLRPGLHILLMIANTVANMFSTLPQAIFYAHEHFDCNIAASINCSNSSSCNDPSHHWRHVSSLVASCIADLNQRGCGKTIANSLRLIARMNVSLKNYDCEWFNLIWTVGKVELISTFTTAVCESWNVSHRYTWDNAGDHKQLFM